MAKDGADAPKRRREAPDRAPEADKRRLLFATIVALLLALLVLLVAVLPAEYGVDPTGLGSIFGFSKLAADEAPAGTTSNSTALFRYRLTWPVERNEVANRTGYASEGTTTNVVVPVDVENVTRVEARLAWVDNNETGGQRTKPDLFEIVVVAPDGARGAPHLGRNGADSAGNVTADFSWREPPPVQQVRAATDAEAAKEAESRVAADRSGVGGWMIQITLHDAGDVDAQGFPFPGPAADRGNDWQLVVVIESFRFDASTLNSSKQREDRVRIEIPAKSGLEYKFDMEEGAEMEYSWNTTGARLYFDFHGEPRGDASGAFTSHGTGTSDRGQGIFAAPFAGTHGWFWENQGPDAVWVELVTSGVYTIVGRK